MSLPKNKSFTLIEVLVVIAIIGLLSSIVLVSLKSARDRAKYARDILTRASIYHIFGVDLSAYWGFEDNAKDDTNVNNGTIQGNPVFTQGVLGKGLKFNGSPDVVRIFNAGQFDRGLNFGISTDFSLSVWFKTSYSWQGILGKDASPRGYLLRTGNNNVEAWYRCFPLGDFIVSANGFVDGDFHHIVAVYDRDDKIILYVDGIKRDEEDISQISCDVSNQWDLFLGANVTSTIYFRGVLDEIMIFNRAITQEEVESIYNAQKSGLN